MLRITLFLTMSKIDKCYAISKFYDPYWSIPKELLDWLPVTLIFPERIAPVVFSETVNFTVFLSMTSAVIQEGADAETTDGYTSA